MVKAITIACLLTLLGCSDQTLRAVGGKSCVEEPSQAACARDTWPNELSRANSDEWLVAHSDALKIMKPRVLVVNLHNQKSPAVVREVAERQIAALAQGSRYRAYLNDSAPVFLSYELLDIVDLHDAAPPTGWAFTSSSQVPLDAKGQFDVAALFSDAFASKLGREDPVRPGRMVPLCEQLERGLLNELWLAVGDTAPGREPPSMIECKLQYDEAGRPLLDAPRVGPELCATLPRCDVTVRIAHLSPLRGVGCDLLVRGWAIRDSMEALPYLAENGARFFNSDLDVRHGAPVDSLLALCPPGVTTPCVRYPAPDALESAAQTGPKFRIDGYGQGCGSPEFPANATFMWDWQNLMPVASRCEHYGLRDGDNGEDAVSLYDASRLAALTADYPECGGAWQIYWRQSMPGLENKARAVDGTPMKNWWPFLFF